MEAQIPNLDDCSIEELWAAETVFRRLQIYASNRRRAHKHRLRGSIQTALALEQRNEKLYASLPDWGKW